MAGSVKIRIDSDGNTHIDVAGMEGTSCETLTEALVRGMGDDAETTYKSEYVSEQELPDYIVDQE